MGENTYLK